MREIICPANMAQSYITTKPMRAGHLTAGKGRGRCSLNLRISLDGNVEGKLFPISKIHGCTEGQPT